MRHSRYLTIALFLLLGIPHACLEDLDYAPRRGLDRAVIRQLGVGRWIVEHHNVLITGATGRRQDVSGLCARAAGRWEDGLEYLRTWEMAWDGPRLGQGHGG